MTAALGPDEGIGCRPVALTALVLLGIAAVLWTAGILLEDAERCTGACSWFAFTLLFAGTPVSAVFTVLGGSDLVFGWPVDIIAWIMIGVGHTKLSGEAPMKSRSWWRATALVVGAALVFGAVMASLVERAV